MKTHYKVNKESSKKHFKEKQVIFYAVAIIQMKTFKLVLQG